jgi:hypothetical protein
MIVAFGTSTPTSITVVATSTSSSRALNFAISSRRLGRSQAAVQEPPRGSPELCAAEPVGLHLRRATDVSDSSIRGQTT